MADKSPSQHDSIAYRLSQILFKLNQGEKLFPPALADEFNVDLRTIQRDLKQRLGFLPLHKRAGRYELDPSFLGKLTFQDVERFAGMAGVGTLFPSLSTDFMRHALGGALPSAWLVKGHHHEEPASLKSLFPALEQAVTDRRLLRFDMGQGSTAKPYTDVAPYRLLNLKGIWYLAAVHHGRYKTFGIGKMQRLAVGDQRFTRDAAIEQQIQEVDGIWHSDTEQQVVLSVAAPAAHYFRRRQLVPRQRIAHEALDGTLQVTTVVGHPNQILPVVRYWVPHLRIVSPAAWQADLDAGLAAYLSAVPPSSDGDTRMPSAHTNTIQHEVHG